MIKIKLFSGFLCFLSLSCFSQVGINTNNPEAALDINGNLKVRTMGAVSIGSVNNARLVLDNSTKEVKMIQSSTGNPFSMNYTTYRLRNVNLDYVQDYDTKISATDYTVVVVGSAFDRALRITGNIGYSPMNIYAFQSNGTWHITADYKDAGTYGNSNGNWSINCLIISNNILKTLPLISINMNGSENGSVGSPPAGL